jgi:hypothetical protein
LKLVSRTRRLRWFNGGSDDTALLPLVLLKIRSIRMLHTVVCSKQLVWLFSPAWDAVILSIPNIIDTNGSPAAARNDSIRSFKLWTDSANMGWKSEAFYAREVCSSYPLPPPLPGAGDDFKTENDVLYGLSPRCNWTSTTKPSRHDSEHCLQPCIYICIFWC